MAELCLNDVMQAVVDLRREMQTEIAELRAALEALESRSPNPAVAGAAKPGVAPDTDQTVSPEVLAIMAGVITAYLGKKVRVRSARLVPSALEAPSPWAQHGRVFVQATAHNLLHIR